MIIDSELMSVVDMELLFNETKPEEEYNSIPMKVLGALKNKEVGIRDGKMAFNEKPLTLNDQPDSFVARRLTQDDTIEKKSFTTSTDEFELKRLRQKFCFVN